jgi:hypothetical protein
MSAIAAAAAVARTRRTALALALLALLAYVLTGGGRVVGSDELAMLDLSRAMVHGGIAVPEGATTPGPDGRNYTKNAAGQAVLALPLVAAAELAVRVAHVGPDRATLAVRFVASFFNAAVTAILLAVLYAGARRFGASVRAALFASLMLGFTTPVWVYAKSFMAEPLQALGLLLALIGASEAAAPCDSGPGAPEAWAGLGALIAISVKLSMLPIALACLAPLVLAPRARWIAPALGVALALAGHAAYDLARFGTPFETGYGGQASPAAFSTPLFVGLYGLLLSSGKGLVWFAPVVLLVPAGVRAAKASRWRAWPASAWRARLGLDHPAGLAAAGALLAWIVGLALYARFQHWAGDGSFGPRYLVPLLPLAFLMVAFAIQAEATRARRALAIVLAALGLLVQVGGVAIYFGAQMREAGDYPYTMALEDPRFMSDSHWNPRFTPIAGHWRMLARNLGEHLQGRHPRMRAGTPAGAEPVDPRTGLTADDQHALLHALDFWWLYLMYAGLGGAAVVAAVIVLKLLAIGAAVALIRTAGAEAAP